MDGVSLTPFAVVDGAATIVDTFAGADASVVATKNWATTIPGTGTLAINAQRALATTGSSATPFDIANVVAINANVANVADVELFAKIEFGSTTPNRFINFYVRSTVATPRVSGGTAYYLRLTNNAGSIGWQLYKDVAGVETGFGTGDSGAVVAGDMFLVRVRIQGTTLSGKHWSNNAPEPSAWNLQVADASIAAAGKVGFEFWCGVASSLTYLHRAEVRVL